jgi:hypothetical protein
MIRTYEESRAELLRTVLATLFAGSGETRGEPSKTMALLNASPGMELDSAIFLRHPWVVSLIRSNRDYEVHSFDVGISFGSFSTLILLMTRVAWSEGSRWGLHIARLFPGRLPTRIAALSYYQR